MPPQLPSIDEVHTLETTVARAPAASLESQVADFRKRWHDDVDGFADFVSDLPASPPLLDFDPILPELTPAEKTFWHSGWNATRDRLAEALVRCGEPAARIDRFTKCGGNTWAMRHRVTGDYRLRSNRCHDRFCLVCQRARSGLISRNVRKALTARDYLHVVLTIRHSDTPLATQIDQLYRWFRKLRSKACWKNYVAGGAAFLEVTRNQQTGRWHPHLHIIAQGRFIPIKDYPGYHRSKPVQLPGLISTWESVTGGSTNVRVDKITDRDAAALEVAKYVTKPLHNSLFEDPDAIDEFIRALKGRRLCATFGNWYKIRLTERSPDWDPADWVFECSLADLVKRADAGELHAAILLQVLHKGSPCQPRPPPAQHRLFPEHGVPYAPCAAPN